jgi:hypothetical protein
MSLRGKSTIRAASIAVVACLAAGAFALSADAAPRGPGAVAAKKCKRKHHGKKRHCKKRKAAAPASLMISPASQDFGVPELPAGATRSFTVTNTGGSFSGLPVTSISGPNADNFVVAANACMASLGPGLTCRIEVNLPPRGAGPVSAMLNVTATPGGTVSAAMAGDIQA